MPHRLGAEGPTSDVNRVTVWKIKMEPENHWFVEANRLPKVHVQVPCLFSRV